MGGSSTRAAGLQRPEILKEFEYLYYTEWRTKNRPALS